METMNTNNTWWHRYRKQKYRSRNYLTTEMIIRKSLSDAVTEYIAEGSPAVAKKIFDKKLWLFARLFWLATSAALFGVICYFLQYTWKNTFEKPFVISIESFTYSISDIEFPAVALCNVNRISKKALKAFTRDMYPKLSHLHINISELEAYYLEMGRLINFNFKEGQINVKLLEKLSKRDMNDQTRSDMKKLAPNCTEMLTQCMWAGKRVSCGRIFQSRRTALGYCCVFNYVLENNSTKGGILGPVKTQVAPGPVNGLNVIIDPLLEDYAFAITPRMGFDVILFDPIHFPDFTGGRVTHRLVEPNLIEYFQLHSVKQQTSSEVRRYPVSTRRCLYRDERKNDYHGMYSHSACLVRCRMHTILAMCRCVPYFMPSVTIDHHDNIRTCTLDDLRCLDKYREKFIYMYPIGTEYEAGLEQEIADSLYCPDCLPDCEYTDHDTNSFKIPLVEARNSRLMANEFTNGVNISNKCIISIFQPTSGSVLRKLDVVAYWFEILSNIGGFAGMMMGIGIFTAEEIIYFFFIRFLWSSYSNYLKDH